MYTFEHRKLKKQYPKLRPRTSFEIAELAFNLEKQKDRLDKETSDLAEGLFRALLLESVWVDNPWMLYLSDEMEKALIDLGHQMGVVNLNPRLPEVGVIGNYLYSITDDRVHVTFNHTGGIWVNTFLPDSDIDDIPDSVAILFGLSAYLDNFPDTLLAGPPSKAVKPLLKTQTSFSLPAEKGTRLYGKSFVRRPHYRALRHKRFKRNADGSVRVVKVKQTELKLVKQQTSNHLKEE